MRLYSLSAQRSSPSKQLVAVAALLTLTLAADGQHVDLQHLADLIGAAVSRAVTQTGCQQTASVVARLDDAVISLNSAGRRLAGIEQLLGRLVEDPAELAERQGRSGDEPLVQLVRDCEPAAQPQTERPELPVCARSCLQLRNQQPPGTRLEDGVYWLSGPKHQLPVYCDMTEDGGGWTLLLTANSTAGWDRLSVLSRDTDRPSLTDNYSILVHGDRLRSLGNSTGRFAYRIEGKAQLGRRRLGGVWLAPRHYSLVSETASQTDVLLVRQFGSWSFGENGLKWRLPWLPELDSVGRAVLTTAPRPVETTGNWWGTLVSDDRQPYDKYKHSPLISRWNPESGTVLYWLREEEM